MSGLKLIVRILTLMDFQFIKSETMNIQTRKLNVINYIVNLTDEQQLKRIEVEILKNQKTEPREYKPFTQDELLARVKESMEDYRKGNFTIQEEIGYESESW